MNARKTTRSRFESHNQAWLRAYLLIPAVTAAIAIALVFTSPSEGGDVYLLGLSSLRWLLVFLLFVLFLIFAGISYLNYQNSQFWKRMETKILQVIDNRISYYFAIGLASILCFISFLLILLTFKFTDQFVLARLQRIFPFLVWMIVFSLQNLVILPRRRKDFPRPNSLFVQLRPSLIVFGALLAIALLVISTRAGLEPDKVGWDNPGVPLLGTQIALAWFFGILACIILHVAELRLGWRIAWADYLVAILIWIVAVWIWQAQPLTPTFFSPTPRAPNYDFYPYSDAATHDIGAQNLLAGEGFPDVIEKPLYSFFLSLLHSVAGQSYANVVSVQIFVLALFPAVLYFIGSCLHHRISGIMLAFAVIFREANAIALSGEIRVSHSKLLMTDLPTALALATITLLIIRWWQSNGKDLRWQLAIGGALGLLVLLRSQTIIFLPIFLVFGLLHSRPDLRAKIMSASVLFLGFTLAATPWLFRNYAVTGQFGYSQPLQAAYLAKQYSLEPETAQFVVPEGTPTSAYASIGYSKVLEFTIGHPVEVFRFITAHFFHNEVSSLLALPATYNLADKIVTFYNLRPYWIGLEDRLWAECCSLSTYISDNPYWYSWSGWFPSEAIFPILINLALISIGIRAIIKRTGWLVFIPIGIHIFYNFSTALARVSGWRLILPVDWVLIMFFMIGIGQITIWVWRYIVAWRDPRVIRNSLKQQKNGLKWKPQKLVPLGLAILFSGLLLPISEIAIPPRYQAADPTMMQSIWNDSELSRNNNLDIAEFIRQPNAQLLAGRALYPRYYSANEGEPGGVGSPYNSLPFSRIAFWLVGPLGDQIALPLDIPSSAFPNASDVLVIGCAKDTYFEARAVLFINQTASDLISGVSDPFICTD
jgi:hypothetical protein